MGYKFREEHPPRQRLTLELVAILATFLVVVGVWTRTVVLGDPTPTAAVAAERSASPMGRATTQKAVDVADRTRPKECAGARRPAAARHPQRLRGC